MANRGMQIVRTVFNTENKVLLFCERVFDIVCLNLLFLVACLPIVTIGIAKLSLYQTMFDMNASHHIHIFRVFGTSFKNYAKVGFKLSLIELSIISLLIFDLILIQNQASFVFLVMKIICIALLILSILFSLVTYPLVVKMKSSVCLITVFKASLLYLACYVVTYFSIIGALFAMNVLIFLSSITFVFGIVLFVLAGFSLLAYGHVKIVEKHFKKNKIII